MNLKESIISSFYFHLILVLLMVAVSHYTTGFQGNIQNILTVDLPREDNNDKPLAMSDSLPKSQIDTSPTADGEMSLPEEKPKETLTPEKRAEAEPAKTEEVENAPIQRDGFASMEAYHQFIMLHKKIFGQQAGARVNVLVGQALQMNKRMFYGGTAIVSLKFGHDSRLDEVSIDSGSPELKAFLEEIDWGIIPPPAAFSLGSKEVKIEFAVLDGYMNYKIETM